MITKIRVALVGMGRIARKEHLPAILASPAYELVAVVDQHGGPVDERPIFRTLAELATSSVDVDAVAICTPPQSRRRLALSAIEQGWHVFLEKPPAATLSEAIALRDAARDHSVSLFASWHSRYAAGVERARAWLAPRRIIGGHVTWHEDIRVWHPGQAWIFQPGGFGVFDAGINAISILTRVWPRALFAERAELEVPSNLAAPIAARVTLQDARGTCLTMDLDSRRAGEQLWEIVIETESGNLILKDGGAALMIAGNLISSTSNTAGVTYPKLYARFSDLIASGMSDVDLEPLRLVADVFLKGRQMPTEPFYA